MGQEMQQIQDPDPYEYPARQSRVQTLEAGDTNSALAVHRQHQLTGSTVPTLRRPQTPEGSTLAQPRLSFGANDKYSADSVTDTVFAHVMPLKPQVDELGVLDNAIVDGFVGVVVDMDLDN